MPVSSMYTWTPEPVVVYEYLLLSGKFLWSSRSRPQGALFWVADVQERVLLDVRDERVLGQLAGLDLGALEREAMERV